MNFSKLFARKQMMKATSAPQPETIPEATPDNPRINDLLVNPQLKAIQLNLYHNGQDSIAKALGALEMAKDMVKANFSQWNARERPRILTSTNGRSH